MTLHNLSRNFTMIALLTVRALSAALVVVGMLALPAHAADASPESSAVKKKVAAPKQRTYTSPEEAVQGLMAAAKAGDSKAMLAILGAGGKPIIFSGDAVADRNGRERFVRSYEEANKIERVSEAKAILATGKDGWPFPVPIVKGTTGWRFDAKAGQEEIVNRRIGRNELAAMQVLQAYVDAQREYYARNPQGDKLLQYAQRVVSSQGKRDGLYFSTKAGEKLSPLGPGVDKAKAEGYSKGDSGYHGYHYRILKGQGPDAPGGAYDYVAQGRMIGGFAMVAWPVSYGNSGVMTFLVNHEGVVFEKDLGPDTAAAVQKITRFNPDKSWKRP
jgi:Protein of unknown function (DUF2950)